MKLTRRRHRGTEGSESKKTMMQGIYMNEI